MKILVLGSNRLSYIYEDIALENYFKLLMQPFSATWLGQYSTSRSFRTSLATWLEQNKAIKFLRSALTDNIRLAYPQQPVLVLCTFQCAKLRRVNRNTPYLTGIFLGHSRTLTPYLSGVGIRTFCILPQSQSLWSPYPYKHNQQPWAYSSNSGCKSVIMIIGTYNGKIWMVEYVLIYVIWY